VQRGPVRPVLEPDQRGAVVVFEIDSDAAQRRADVGRALRERADVPQAVEAVGLADEQAEVCATRALRADIEQVVHAGRSRDGGLGREVIDAQSGGVQDVGGVETEARQQCGHSAE